MKRKRYKLGDGASRSRGCRYYRDFGNRVNTGCIYEQGEVVAWLETDAQR